MGNNRSLNFVKEIISCGRCNGMENENINCEMFDRDTREENYEMIDVSNLEDDTENKMRYIRGRKENYETGE